MGKKVEKALKGLASGTSRTNLADNENDATPEPYTCTGNFPDDFTELWQRAGLEKDFIPVIKSRVKRPGTPVPAEDKMAESDDAQASEKPDEEQPPTTYTQADNLSIYRPSIQVEYDIEETKTITTNFAKEIFIRSWKLEEKVISVLKQCVLDRLHCINLWNAGLTEVAVQAIANMLPSLLTVKTLVLDANPIPDTEPYHLLIGEDSVLQNLSLRNNRITEKGAQQLAHCLGNSQTQNRCLATLNLSFNQIGDEGAKFMAQAMRMNRVLLSLSLASNGISNIGCAALAEVLQEFTLTHPEVVQRRKMLSRQAGNSSGRGTSSPVLRTANSERERPGSNRSGSQATARTQRASGKKKSDAGKKADAGGGEKGGKKDGKKAASATKHVRTVPEQTETQNDNGNRKTTGAAAADAGKGAAGKGKTGKSAGKDGGKRGALPSITGDPEPAELPEVVSPLLEPGARHADGKVYLTGCLTLVNLNLSRNEIGLAGMEAMFNAIRYQADLQRRGKASTTAPGLMKIHLQRNAVEEDHVTFTSITESMLTRDPLYKPESSKTPDDDTQSLAPC